MPAMLEGMFQLSACGQQSGSLRLRLWTLLRHSCFPTHPICTAGRVGPGGVQEGWQLVGRECLSHLQQLLLLLPPSIPAPAGVGSPSTQVQEGSAAIHIKLNAQKC